MDFNFNHVTKCPVCGEELVVIDNMNYITMICPKCHSTVFEELDNTIHVIENGIMKDGYNASLDIFYKQLIAYSLYAKFLSAYQRKKFWSELKTTGIIANEDILANGIYDYFINMTKGFKMRKPCIYFDGYEKYLQMSKPEADRFKEQYM
jgi:ribosomal protein S27AE